MKIDANKLAADAYRRAESLYPNDVSTSPRLQKARNEHFARLVMEDCVRACQDTSVLSIPHTHNWTSLKAQETLIESIRARMP